MSAFSHRIGRRGEFILKRDLVAFVLSITLLLLCCASAALRFAPAFSAGTLATSPTLILDAGHGGEDGGAVSAAGDKESDINLAIVLKLEYLMAFLGVETVLTRSEDVSIYDEGCDTLHEKKVSDLKNRVALIQSTSNAMVISVHQNTFTDPRYQGAQVFYGFGDISRQWGVSAQEIISAVLDPDNQRKAAPIPEHVYLFQHIDCPAILVECGFLSNGEEASLLLTDSYQRKIAVALAGAYLHELQMIPNPLGGD